MPIVPYAKESTKSFNASISANNATTLQSNANESIERKIGYVVNKTNASSQATITDEKPVKNLSNVFRDIDAKKIQSNAKDIEDESTNILQSRRSTVNNSGTSATITTTTTTTSTSTPAIPHEGGEAATNQTSDPISMSVNDVSTTEQTLLPQANQTNVANVRADAILPQKRHRRHRQQR